MFRFLWKVTRPIQFTSAFAGTWLTALLCSSSTDARWLSAVSMGMGCLGASLFHYGAARKMYARKAWDLVEVKRPALLVAWGSLAFISSIAIASTISWICFLIVCFDAAAVTLYSRVLSRTWMTKNITIAVVCTTPILLGWAAGTKPSLLVNGATVTVFFSYLAREILKDIQDIKANHGIRVTLPMVIGTDGALLLAGVMTTLGGVSALAISRYNLTTAICAFILLIVAYRLIIQRNPTRAHQGITVGITGLILAFVNPLFV